MRSRAFFLLVATWILAGLFLLDLFGMAMAMAAMAAEIEGWPIYVVLIPGIALIVVTFLVAGNLEQGQRCRVRLALVPPSALYLLFVVWIGSQEFSAVRERFIIPAGFHGNVYVFHGVRGAASSTTGWHSRTYEINNDGIAVTSDGVVSSSQASYFDRMPNGALRRIQNAWYATIDDTPANRANNQDRGMFFHDLAREEQRRAKPLLMNFSLARKRKFWLTKPLTMSRIKSNTIPNSARSNAHIQ